MEYFDLDSDYDAFFQNVHEQRQYEYFEYFIQVHQQYLLRYDYHKFKQ